jgi:hypothetical protein
MNLRKLIKEEIDDFEWVTQHMETVPDEPHYLALAKCYGTEVLEGMNTEENPTYEHYGIDVYENGEGHEYAVGDRDTFHQALMDYYDNLIDEVGLDGWNTDVESYMYMTTTDARFWASDLADGDMDSFGGDEMVERSTYSDEFDELISNISDLEERISEKEDELVQYDEENDSEQYMELEDELDVLRDELKTMEGRKEDIYDNAREEFRNDRYESHLYALENDPIDYLVNDLGLYGDVQELYDNNVFGFDRDKFCEDLANEGHYGEISSWDGEYCMEHIDGTDYICIVINK